MAKLTLTGLKCFKQEDWTFDDDIQIVVYNPDHQAVWRNSMDEGQTRTISGVTIEFTGSVKVQLLEKDWEGDDNLGTVTISDAKTVAKDREAKFQLDDADYSLWYRVSNEATDVEDRSDEYNKATQENPLTKILDDLLGPFLEPLGLSDLFKSKSECPMGELAVRVMADGKPIEGAKVSVREIGVNGVTNKDGIFNVGPVMEGDYTCEAAKENYAPNPGSTVGHVTAGTCSTVEVTLGKVKVVKVMPSGNTTLRQYVNLDQDESKRHGRELTISAEITPKIKGIRVYFQLRYWDKNRKIPPADTELKPYSALTDDNGIAKTKITFGTCGGDNFRVAARLDPNEEPMVFSAWLEVWRKMYYEITEMKKPTGGSFVMEPGVMGIVEGSYKKVFVELVNLGKNVLNKDNKYVDNFDNGDGTDEWADKYCSNQGVPWKIHYAVVANADEKIEEEIVFKEITVRSGKLKVQNSDGTWRDYWIKPWQFHGEDWLLKALYREKGAGSWDNDKKFAAGSVTLTDTGRSDGWRRINVAFPAAVDPTTKTQEVRLKLRRRGGINGWGGTSLHLVICRNTFDGAYPGAKLKPAMAGTSIHEPAHSLGLVYGGQPWEIADADHSRHCKYMDCVMWWQGYEGRPHDFHPPTKSDPGCNTFLREKDMSRAAMTPKWKFPR